MSAVTQEAAGNSALTTPRRGARKTLGAMLLDRGAVDPSAIAYCLHEQKVTGEKLGQVLVRCGFAAQREVMGALAEQLGMEVVDVEAASIDPDCLAMFNAVICRRNHFVPLGRAQGKLVVATCAPDFDKLRVLIERHTGLQAELKLAEKEAIHRLLTHYYENQRKPPAHRLEREIIGVGVDKDAARRLDGLVRSLVATALHQRATDIHLRPMPHSINVAFRVDGVLISVLSLDQSFQRLIATIKLMAGMDIAETRRAQDGSFALDVDDSYYDVRVSTIACSFGENVVMRLLPRSTDVRRLETLGFETEHLTQLRQMFRRPSGIFLITGPTGSGKTTTLHAGIMSLDVLNKNILTIEDPIEYQLPVVRQTQVNRKSGYVFAGAIRNFLRHDPDVIVVGEIRDAETAAAALDAAETGHLVLSTMHTNSAVGIVPRLKSLQANTYQLADVLIGALSQRLVRSVCRHCAAPRRATAEEAAFLQVGAETLLTAGKGCAHCGGTGYLGRVPIYEIAEFTDEFRAAVHDGVSQQELVSIARRGRYVSMHDVARAKVLSGQTTVAEAALHMPAAGRGG